MSNRSPSVIPNGAWPPRMPADMAAGYCGEKTVEDFLARVGTDYPKPRVVDTTRRRFWYRDDLDRAMNIGAGQLSSGMGKAFAEKIREKRSG
jgi:non-ribosomal peptide synthetase component E (peptide arylation enzyme)